MLTEPGTFSKSPANWGLSSTLAATAGRGAAIRLNNDSWYLDMTSSLGQSLFAYDAGFLDYLAGWVLLGSSFTLPHELESRVAVKLASILGERVPGWNDEKIGVRFGSSGSDVTLAAIRVARAFTKRMPILTFKDHYHGWGEAFIGRVEPALGCKTDYSIYQHSWGEPIDKYPDNFFAAIIFEQPGEAPPRNWLRSLRRYCLKNDTLLIADEVVTGLRYGLGGACEFYGYHPDLVCMGKALANGYRLSALVGKWDIMQMFTGDSPVFWSSTASGNALELAACDWVLSHYGVKECGELWRLGQKLLEGLFEIGYQVNGYPVRFVIAHKSLVHQAYFIKRMFDHKILFNRPVMVNLAMTNEDINSVLEAAGRIWKEMSTLPLPQLKALAEPLPRVLFRGNR